ncbi:MAG: enoyl-CoA hydratase-related protein [candidate division KSB1 bacterium]|nr:enoyl-CoA hydratase-related protein [candidate division KSB1 bacterium]
MEFKNLVIERSDAIGIIKINRPESLNALNIETLGEIRDAVTALNNEEEIKVVIFTGEGKAFIAGADIKQMKDMTENDAREFSNLGQKIFDIIENLDKPVIAAVNGFALGGGCELAMACDIRIASENAKFGQPEVNLGVIPGFGGTQRLSRLVGKGIAKELIFTGDIIDAQTAFRIGLVNKVVAPENLLNDAIAMAQKIASKGPAAVLIAKSVINRGLEVDQAKGMAIERDGFVQCVASGEAKEGMEAFVEKRKPNWP